MNTPSAKLQVMVGDRFACIKIIGRANFNSSIDFKNLVSELCQHDCKFFVLDLSECLLMDSTFLGTLAGLGLRMNPGEKDPASSPVELLNPSTRITELLENLGILYLFRVTQGLAALPSCSEIGAHTLANPTREDTVHACLEAHRTLMEINPDNVSRFREVAQFLAEDLNKLKGAT
jgi:anti-anti-sigma regulatory factor